MAKKTQKLNGGKSILNKIGMLRSQISPDTERSILSIIVTAIALIFILAAFHKAGPAGETIYNFLTVLFGLGYYLFPTIFLIIAAVFLFEKEQKRNLTITAIGATLFINAGLGLIDVLFPEKGGLIGRWIGSIETPFGYVSAIILTGAFLLIALLLTANIPLMFRKKEKLEETEKETEIIVKNTEALEKTNIFSESKTQPKKEMQEKSTDDELAVENPKAFFIPKKSTESESAFGGQPYVPPPPTLLKSSIEKPTSGDLRANANIIKRTLDSFGIPVEMGEISIGPKVTRYTLKPAEGIKLARIVALNQDLSLALAAHPIRIEAPIPGKSLVGIEVPNKSAAIVRLGSLMAFPDFISAGPLSFIIGRDVSGEPIIADIEKMPHLLIAGSTGSGKSVAIHALLVSLLYKNSPETLRLILIDPKRVELTIYNDIPHLISPVITEGKKALGVFRWAISEMERRYEKLQAAGARDIKSYNKSNPDDSMHYLLIVVDELADLMAAFGRDIESSVVRLAQMARATGIHLIVTTQRPSVEVITGLIKANITSRIALQVASQVDSRTILDMAGAEKLLGGGDMLFTSSELSKPKRIQGAYISEEELHKVTDFIRDNNESIPDQNIANAGDKNPTMASRFEEFSSNDAEDELYDEAVAVVREAQKASASLLQRRLAVGYARAARLLDIMEERGIVGPGDGAKPREVFLDKEENI